LKKSLLLLLLLVIGATLAHSADSGLCRHVIDGDTIIVSGVGKVRLIGVDTPELAHDERPAEPGAYEARQYVIDRAKDKEVRLEYDWERRDKYGRVLAYVYLPDGELLNEELLTLGLAKPMRFFKYRLKERFLKIAEERP
jgi:micrococcal nuclease